MGGLRASRPAAAAMPLRRRLPPPRLPSTRPPPGAAAASRGAAPPAPVVRPVRVSASLRLLLVVCALLLAPLPAWAAVAVPTADAGVATAADARETTPTIGADAGPLDDGVRASERAELLSTLGQVLAIGGVLPRTTAGIPAPASCRAVGWSDVVQCRRWSGAHLLRWATPPPARA